MKKFCKFLRDHAIKITKLRKRNLLQKGTQNPESYINAKICYICNEKFQNKYVKDKKYSKVRDLCNYIGEYRGAMNIIFNLKNSVTKKFL